MRPLDELQKLSMDVEAIESLPDLKPVFSRVEAISKENIGDTEVEAMVKQLKMQLVIRGKKLKESGAGAAGSVISPSSTGERSSFNPPSPPSGPAYPPMPPPPNAPPIGSEFPTGPLMTPSSLRSGQTPSYPPPPMPPPMSNLGSNPSIPTTAVPLPPPMPPPGASGSGNRPTVGVFAVPPPQPPAKPAGGSKGLNWKRAVLIGALLGLVGFAAIFVVIVNFARDKNKGDKGGNSAGIALPINTVPPGAKIQINGEDKCTSPCSVQLAPGNYRITAQLEGYDSTLAVATVAAGQPANEISMTLTSQAQSLRIFSDIGGKVQLDGKPVGEIAEGSFILDRVAAGPHTVQVTGPGAESSFAFEINAGKAPVITSAPTARNLLAILVSTSGNTARLQASVPSLKAQLDGKDQPAITSQGTDLANAPAGDHELVVGDGKETKKLQVSFLSTPAITAYLRSDVNAGNLLIATNPPEDEVTIVINGRTQPKKTSRGQYRIQLPPGNVAVKVSKDGFETVAEQAAVVKKGEDVRLEFKLKTLPRMATLRVRSATSGALVFLDGREIGRVGADGSFQTGAVAPGDHEVEFRMAGFLNQKATRSFKAGETAEIANIVLMQAVGTILLNLSPADAKVTLKHAPDADRTITGTTISNLQPGQYTLIARAPGHTQILKVVSVTGGQSTTVDLTLAKEQNNSTPQPQLRPGSISDFDPAWDRDGDQYTHKGSPIAFRITPTAGTFSFKVQLVKGGNVFGAGKKIRWALGYTDGRNQANFELEKNKIRRNTILNGKSSKGAEFKWDAAMDTFPVQIEVTPNSVIHRIQIAGQWTVVDRLTEAEGISNGKFVFLLNNNEEIAITEFKFTPSRF